MRQRAELCGGLPEKNSTNDLYCRAELGYNVTRIKETPLILSMFETLSDRLDSFFKNLRREGRLTEKNIAEVSQKLRLTLLEADVYFKVAKEFVDQVTTLAVGQKVHEKLSPHEHYIDIVRQELTALLGGETSEINLRVKPPLTILLIGLQGSGKTTTAVKLAKYFRDEKRRSPLLVSVDVYRPAAIEQLKIFSAEVNLRSLEVISSQSPLDICRAALKEAEVSGFDTLIFDSAGRFQMDEPMMEELKNIRDFLLPHEILLVADAALGQQAVAVATDFDRQLNISGLILTKLDADSRGGAALSMKKMTGKPIKFVGFGEKVDRFDLFHPDRMARRILKMGDMLTLIERAKKSVDIEKSAGLERRIERGEFTLRDFRDQIREVEKIGSWSEILKLIPGGEKMMSGIPNPPDPQNEFKKVNAIMDSMTLQERENIGVLNGKRRLRIANGSGTTVSQVNKLVKQFLDAKKMMKKIPKFGRNR